MRQRRGVALVAALMLMAFVAFLIAASIATAQLARRSSRAADVDASLAAAADFALNTLLGDARARALDSLPFGRAVEFDDPSGAIPGIATTITATRLARGVVWLVAESREAGGGRRRVNVVARWPMPASLPAGALTSRGGVRIAPGVQFAVDTTGDPDCRASFDSPGVVVADGAALDVGDSVRVAVRAVDDSVWYAEHLGAAAGRDDAIDVRRIAGDTTIADGEITGVLFVGGRLTITGTVVVTGLVVAFGPIDAHAGRLDVTGAILSYFAPTGAWWSVDLGAGTLRFSPCLVARLVRRISALRPVRARGWAELY